jgi:hypothetical protein
MTGDGGQTFPPLLYSMCRAEFIICGAWHATLGVVWETVDVGVYGLL